MKYLLRRDVLASGHEIELTSNDFEKLSIARKNLFELLAIEEKYDLLIRNYSALEQSIYNTSSHGLLYNDLSWSDFIEHIQSINLALMNLLAMCRSYIDHLPQHLASLFPANPEHIESFHSERKSAYDDYLGYRALYCIRNHVQHYGMPVHSFTQGGNWIEDRASCMHASIPFVNISELEKNISFKKSVLHELRNIGDKIDLRLLCRENMSAFGAIHKHVRKLTENTGEESELVISECIENFKKNCEADVVGLSIEKIDANHETMEKLSIFDDMNQRRNYLRQKNRTLTNMEKHFVSGQIRTNNK